MTDKKMIDNLVYRLGDVSRTFSGRIKQIRSFGKLSFIKVENPTGSIQVALSGDAKSLEYWDVIASTLAPSTKTAAAMYIIPAIVNNEQLKADSSELYKLAIGAAKEALGKENKDKSEQ